MSLHVIVVTLGANAAAIITPSAGNPSIRCRELRIENEQSNADVKVGDNTLSSTNYGATVHAETATSSNAITFRQPSHSIDLSNVFLLGTQGQKVHITYVQ